MLKDNHLLSPSKEPTSFKILYEKYRYSMFYVAKNILRDDGLAEDAVQNTFLSIYKNIHILHFDSDTHVKAFLIRSVQNAAKDIIKSRTHKHEETIFDELENVFSNETENSALDKLLIREAIEVLKKAIDTMDSNTANVIRLCLQYEYNESDVAKLLNLSPGNVRVILHRGRKKLLAVLQKEGII